jgi:hypothetical protein
MLIRPKATNKFCVAADLSAQLHKRILVFKHHAVVLQKSNPKPHALNANRVAQI